jgi:hypothetical protein
VVPHIGDIDVARSVHRDAGWGGKLGSSGRTPVASETRNTNTGDCGDAAAGRYFSNPVSVVFSYVKIACRIYGKACRRV